ncbi:MAG TPA: aromatic amino acid lyase, partial [Chitinophagaceae bacterium]|nr:aromatic amino acid lyase [Chitinophagaceae bacterium]
MRIEITGGDLTLKDFNKIVFENAQVSLNKAAVTELDKCFHFLKSWSEKKLIYGINTGFGPMAQYRINNEDRNQLQYNLIRSHA